MSEAESAPSSPLAGVTAINCLCRSNFKHSSGPGLRRRGPFHAVHIPTTCYLLAALIQSQSRVRPLCFVGRFSTAVTLWGSNKWMKSKGVADNILTPKIHLRGQNGTNLLGDFPQQICLRVSFLPLRGECFIWSGPYCPGRRRCGRTKQRCLGFEIPPRCNLEEGKEVAR